MVQIDWKFQLLKNSTTIEKNSFQKKGGKYQRSTYEILADGGSRISLLFIWCHIKVMENVSSKNHAIHCHCFDYKRWKNNPHCCKKIWKYQITHKNLNGFSFVTITNYETFVGQMKIFKASAAGHLLMEINLKVRLLQRLLMVKLKWKMVNY